jgi:hypothetical protein
VGALALFAVGRQLSIYFFELEMILPSLSPRHHYQHQHQHHALSFYFFLFFFVVVSEVLLACLTAIIKIQLMAS